MEWGDIKLDFFKFDLEVNGKGDIEIVKGDNEIAQAVIHRLRLSPIAYKKNIFKRNGEVIRIDDDYGNNAYNYLSTASDFVAQREIMNSIRQALNSEDRIVVTSLKRNDNQIQSIHNIAIEYEINNIPTTINMQF